MGHNKLFCNADRGKPYLRHFSVYLFSLEEFCKAHKRKFFLDFFCFFSLTQRHNVLFFSVQKFLSRFFQFEFFSFSGYSRIKRNVSAFRFRFFSSFFSFSESTVKKFIKERQQKSLGADKSDTEHILLDKVLTLDMVKKLLLLFVPAKMRKNFETYRVTLD